LAFLSNKEKKRRASYLGIVWIKEQGITITSRHPILPCTHKNVGFSCLHILIWPVLCGDYEKNLCVRCREKVHIVEIKS
jgi:hypothetical protein